MAGKTKAGGTEKFWDSEKILAEIEKGTNTTITFKIVTKNGKTFAESREWFYDTRRSSRPTPTKKGHVLQLDDVEDFIAGWNMLHDELKELKG